MWGTLVSEMQSDVAVTGNKITGTLHYISEGQIVRDWGEGYFLAMKWSDIDEGATSLKVGLQPSEGTGLIECLDDPDHNGMFHITNKNTQDLIILSSAEGHRTMQNFDLSGLVLEPKQ